MTTWGPTYFAFGCDTLGFVAPFGFGIARPSDERAHATRSYGSVTLSVTLGTGLVPRDGHG